MKYEWVIGVVLPNNARYYKPISNTYLPFSNVNQHSPSIEGTQSDWTVSFFSNHVNITTLYPKCGHIKV